jgi:hypothetical protein
VADYAHHLLARVRALHQAFDAFAWKQGARGGKYWLPDGKPDQAAFRLYGTRAERAAGAAGQKGKEAKAEAKVARPAQAAKIVRAKAEVAWDAVRQAKAAGVAGDRLAWLLARAEKAVEDLAAMEPPEPKRK